MNDLKPLTCPNCGGRINAARMRCEYCGTEFKRDEGPVVRIEAVRPGVRTLEAVARIPEYYIQHLLRDSDNDEIVNMVGDQMTHDLAKALVPMLDLKVGHDLERMEAVVRGRIRVLEPGYRF